MILFYKKLKFWIVVVLKLTQFVLLTEFRFLFILFLVFLFPIVFMLKSIASSILFVRFWVFLLLNPVIGSFLWMAIQGKLSSKAHFDDLLLLVLLRATPLSFVFCKYFFKYKGSAVGLAVKLVIVAMKFQLIIF